MAARVDPDRLWGHLTHLCENIGPRLSGTPADERTVRYIAAHFRKCGARVEVQDYPCPGWLHRETRLELRGRRPPQALPAVAQTFTEACDVAAEIAVVGTPHDLEFRPDLEGKLLVVHGEAGSDLALDRNPRLMAIEERRPAAVVVVSPVEDVSSKLVRDPLLRVPLAAVSLSAGRILKASQGQRAWLRIRARRYASTSHNVIGRFAGSAEGRIVVGAHYDTAAGTMGATDDASGTAALLELCETLGSISSRKLSIELVAFGAEEYGRHVRALGSVAFARRFPEALRDCRGMVQMDGVGTTATPPGAYVFGWPAARKDELLRVFARFPRYRVAEEPMMGSDHVPFHLHGVPVVFFMNAYESIPIHTPRDSLELMDKAELAYSAETAEAVISHLAEG